MLNWSIVAHTQLQSRKGRSLLAEQLFGMFDICIPRIVMHDNQGEEEERKKDTMKQGEQN